MHRRECVLTRHRDIVPWTVRTVDNHVCVQRCAVRHLLRHLDAARNTVSEGTRAVRDERHHRVRDDVHPGNSVVHHHRSGTYHRPTRHYFIGERY